MVKKPFNFFTVRNDRLVSPIGRNCSQEERIAFYEYDKEHKVREKMINVVQFFFHRMAISFFSGF